MKKLIFLLSILSAFHITYQDAMHYFSEETLLNQDQKISQNTGASPENYKKIERSKKMVYSFSIPKCGTHLMFKCLSLMDIQPFKLPIDQSKSINEKLAELHNKYHTPGTYIYYDPQLVHLIYTKNHEKKLRDNRFAYFFIIRDPRDQMVSQIYHMKLRPEEYPTVKNMSIDDILLGIIAPNELVNVEKLKPRDEYERFLKIGGTVSWYRDYVNWIKYPYIQTIKFEHLVGPDGGGTLKNQHNEIKKIAKHIGITIDEAEVAKIGKDLFGGSGTFRAGKIGSWKTHFKPHHKAAFKKNKLACKILKDLGYEKDNNW